MQCAHLSVCFLNQHLWRCFGFACCTSSTLTLSFRWMKNISPVSSRCLLSLHTRLGRSQGRQRETLQDPQAWQWGILHNYTSAVWHITEACQALHRYVVCKAPRSLSLSVFPHSLFIAAFHHTWKLLSVTPAALCHHALSCATCNRHQSVTKGDE